MKPRLLRTNPASEKRLRQACELPAPEALAAAGGRAEGLSETEAAERLKRSGPNLIAGEKKPGALLQILERLRDPLVIQLLAICALSFAMGDARAGIVVGGMIAISVFLSYFQERRSGDLAEKLKRMVRANAVALRSGAQAVLPIADVVPGDVVCLSSGSIVPADLRLVSAKDFFVTQAALTGESMPVEKTAEAQPDSRALSVFELGNACFQGSTVLSGSALGLAVSTGGSTFLGAVAASLEEPKAVTDFDIGMRSFVRLMVSLMVAMVSVTFLIVGLTKGNWLEAILFGLSVAVGLTPEMLPMIVTVCLSKGAIFMSRKKVIVKKLKAIQNLGAMDVLCTDKTGTITQDRVALEKHVDVTGRKDEDVLRYAWMNSRYQTGLRNLLDESILSHADLDVDRDCAKLDEIPFDFQRKRMSVVLAYSGFHVLICKGAVEPVFEACDRYQVDGEVLPLLDAVRQDVLEDYGSLSRQGYRVLAVAYREYDTGKKSFSAADEAGLILLGYLAFFDPPKDSAAKAIASLTARGVRVKVLTGDNDLVTRKVCLDVGFPAQRVVTGPELEAMTDKEFARAALDHDLFARLSPRQKESLVAAMRSGGHVVGFMGDGINDAAAMRAADVGVSVDTAVDVAKESADIILLEKNLLVLEDGIIEGRRLFNNIVKYIRMSASSNFGNMISVLGSACFLPFLPMAPVQILLNNLLYDISQTGIPLDNVDEASIRAPQRWDIGSIRRFMFALGPVSSLFDYATFALMFFVFGCSAWYGAPAAARPAIEALFHTGWFVESLLTQTLVIHIIRTERIPFLQSRASLAMMLSGLAVAAVGISLVYSPLAPFFGLAPLPLSYWPWLAAFLACYAILATLVKNAFVHANKRRKTA